MLYFHHLLGERRLVKAYVTLSLGLNWVSVTWKRLNLKFCYVGLW